MWTILIAAPFLALALVAATVPPGMLWQPEDPHGYDVVEYHLQAPREWFEAGKIVPLHHNVYGYFPFNVEMHYLWAMHLRGGPWAGMYLSQFMHMGFMMLAVLAVHGVCRRLACERGAILAALLFAVTPWTAQLGSVAYDEGGMILFGALAVGWAMIAMMPSRGPIQKWALAGAMAGFAAGCKLTAVPEVLVAVPMVCAAVGLWGWVRSQRNLDSVGSASTDAVDHATNPTDGSLQQRTNRSAEADPTPKPLTRSSTETPGEGRDHLSPGGLGLGLVVFCMMGALTFLPWLARNYAWTGNPVFPEAMSVLGAGDFTATQVERWKLAHKAVPGQQVLSARLAVLVKEVVLGWQYGYIVPIGLIGCALAWRRPMAWVLMGLMLALTLFWLFFTHLQGRFFILAVPLAAMLVGLAPWNRMSFRIAIAALAIVASVGFWRIHLRLNGKLYEQKFIEAIGFEDFRWMPHGGRMLRDLPADAQIYLVGESRAFWFDVPMSRLHCRTAFDVRDSDDFSCGWLGPDAPPAGSWILTDPNEINRLTGSYWKLPPIPAGVLARPQPSWRVEK